MGNHPGVQIPLLPQAVFPQFVCELGVFVCLCWLWRFLRLVFSALLETLGDSLWTGNGLILA